MLYFMISLCSLNVFYFTVGFKQHNAPGDSIVTFTIDNV